MPKEAYRQGDTFLVTVSTKDRFPWFSRHEALAASVTELLTDMARERDTVLFAWSLMPDHLHLLLIDVDVLQFVRMLKGRATPIARRIDPNRRLWQRSFHDHGLRHHESIEDVSLYIFENPVRAGLVTAPEDYQWSGSNVWAQWRRLY